MPAGVYAVEGQYIWDSWIVEDQGILHRYALSAPSDKLTPNERHQHAFVRHAISENGGVTWTDKGPAIQPSGIKGVWPDKVIWTSSVMIREENGEKTFLMFITGRNQEDNDEMNQEIGITTSKDGQHFTRPRRLFYNPPSMLVNSVTTLRMMTASIWHGETLLLSKIQPPKSGICSSPPNQKMLAVQSGQPSVMPLPLTTH
ncbi:MAG: hypothetical protein U9N60_08675 [Thermodesulfobacteriota bacterium]|nr:hypothetical protein [Thermodesulfobacteriota bacterium]